MTILFMILKIIGIVLLIILGILVVVLLTVLFVPLRYNGQLFLPEEGEMDARITLTYLLHLISVSFFYREKKPEAVLRILFFKKELLTEQETEDENRVPDTKKKKGNGSKRSGAKKNRTGFIVALPAMVKELQKEENKEAFHLCIDQIKYLCRHFGPHKMQGTLSFSMGDPCYTGIALGAISMFPILYQNDFHIWPDFESEKIYAKGNLTFSGHIRTIHGLVCIIRLMKNKTIRKLIVRGGQSNVRK